MDRNESDRQPFRRRDQVPKISAIVSTAGVAVTSGIDRTRVLPEPRRLEVDLSIRTYDQNYSRRVHWSTVVASGAELSADQREAGTIRRQIIPVCILSNKLWQGSVTFDLEVRLNGRRVELPEEIGSDFRFSRQPNFNNGSLSKSEMSRWFPWGDFNVLCVSGSSEEPKGWREAFRDEVNNSLINSTGTTQIQSIPPEALPLRPEGYTGLDRLVLLALRPEQVSEAQRAALQAAVRLGLRVWVIPGKNGDGNGWFGDALRGVPSVTRTDPGGNSRPFFFIENDPGTRRTSTRFSEEPLTVSYSEGAGEWLRYTSPLPPFRFSERSQENWGHTALQRVLVPQDDRRGSRRVSDQLVLELDGQFRRSVDAEALFLFVVIYLLVAGPGLFVFLKKKGKLPWLLWLQPTVVVLFLLGTGLIGWAKFGVANRTDHTVILYQKSGETGGVLLHVRSLYSSVSAARNIAATPEGSLPFPVPAAVRSTPLEWSFDGNEPSLRRFRTKFWSLNHFTSARGVDLGEVEVMPGALRTVSAHNGLPFPIQNLSLRERSLAHELRQLLPGETAKLNSVGTSDPDSFGTSLTSRGSADRASLGWVRVRRELRNWPDVRSNLRVSMIAEFDPKHVAKLLEEDLGGAKAYLVVLTEEGR